ncbi:MAG: hypothetical protein ACRC2T_06340, partial [Thermoguttaceae bacterium]
KKTRGVIFLLLCIYLYVFAVLYGMYTFLPVTAISKKTTYVTEPLTPNGLAVDALQAIADKMLPKCPPEQNGFGLIVQNFKFGQLFPAVSDENKQVCKTRMYEALGLDPNSVKEGKNIVTFETSEDYFKNIYEEECKNKGLQNSDVTLEEKINFDINVYALKGIPWGGEYKEKAEKWVAENSAALDLFAEAVRKPAFFVPYIATKPITHPSFLNEISADNTYYFFRDISRGLQMRILHSLEHQNIEQAFADLETMLLLLKHTSKTFCSFTQFYIIPVIWGNANESIKCIIKFGNLDVAQISRLEKMYNEVAIPTFSTLVFIYRMDVTNNLYYTFNGDIFANLSNKVFHSEKSDFENRVASIMAPLFFASTRYFIATGIFEQFQLIADRFEKIAEEPFSRDNFERYQNECEARRKTRYSLSNLSFAGFLFEIVKTGALRSVSNSIADTSIKLTLDTSIEPGNNSIYRLEAEKRMFNIMFALEKYRLEHDGQYPEKLDELVPQYLPELPLDPYTKGDEFHFRITAPKPDTTDERETIAKTLDLQYEIYSVGPNGLDDDGLTKEEKTDPDTGEKIFPKKSDDVVLQRFKSLCFKICG